MVASTLVYHYSVSDCDASTFECQVFSKFNLPPSASHRSNASASEAASSSRSCRTAEQVTPSRANARTAPQSQKSMIAPPAKAELLHADRQQNRPRRHG